MLKLKNDVSIERQNIILPTGDSRPGWVIQVVREVPVDVQVFLGGFLSRENWVHAVQIGDGRMVMFFDPIVEVEEEAAIMEEIASLFERHDFKVKIVERKVEPSFLEKIFEGLSNEPTH